MSQWKANVTVASIVERQGQFLIVEEHTSDGLRFNQPAGHWEFGETLLDAVVRETREETGWLVEPESLVGIYSGPKGDGSDIVYLRFAFVCRALSHQEGPLDAGIVAAHWRTLDEIQAQADRHRSPLVMRCFQDYVQGQRFPLNVLLHL